MSKPLHKALHDHRTACGMNPTQAAGLIGVARREYRMWEFGARLPDSRYWPVLAEWMGMSLSQLMAETGLTPEKREPVLLFLFGQPIHESALEALIEALDTDDEELPVPAKSNGRRKRGRGAPAPG